MNRKLDSEIAEKVMGLDVTKVPGGKWEDFYYTSPGRVAVKPYSSDISAAWEVVAKLREGGVWMECYAGYSDTEVSIGWYCHIHAHEGSVSADDPYLAPMAICKAALKAVEG